MNAEKRRLQTQSGGKVVDFSDSTEGGTFGSVASVTTEAPTPEVAAPSFASSAPPPVFLAPPPVTPPPPAVAVAPQRREAVQGRVAEVGSSFGPTLSDLAGKYKPALDASGLGQGGSHVRMLDQN